MNTQELNNVLSCLVSNCPKLKKVCETWGDQHMLTIAMEENAELIQAISKIKRNGVDPINASHLDEEVADVLICICELYVMNYLDVREIARIIERKIGDRIVTHLGVTRTSRGFGIVIECFTNKDYEVNKNDN